MKKLALLIALVLFLISHPSLVRADTMTPLKIGRNGSTLSIYSEYRGDPAESTARDLFDRLAASGAEKLQEGATTIYKTDLIQAERSTESGAAYSVTLKSDPMESRIDVISVPTFLDPTHPKTRLIVRGRLAQALHDALQKSGAMHRGTQVRSTTIWCNTEDHSWCEIFGVTVR